MPVNSMTKEKRFFEYLLELTKLTGKVIRDYREYEKHWIPSELKEIEGCFVDADCEDEDTYLEIHRPQIDNDEKIPPNPNSLLREWLDFDVNNENSTPSHVIEKRYHNEHGEEIVEKFEADNKRFHLYQEFINEWTTWAENLQEKKKQFRLYNEFFDLVSRFEREGESLEFAFGRGILTWRHPDSKIGVIRSPLLTQILELNLDAEQGVITATVVDQTINVEREMLSGVSLPNKKKAEEIFNHLRKIEMNDDISDLFTQLVHTIDANGEFKDYNSNITIGKSPIIYDHTIFVFRVKNTRVVRDDLENILEQLDSGSLTANKAIRSLLGEDVNSEHHVDVETKTDADIEFTKNRLFFPLPFNEQQKEIVNRIERNYGLTVQGRLEQVKLIR